MSKPRIVCIAGGGNNEECILDFLGDSYEPSLFLTLNNQACRYISRAGGHRNSVELPLCGVPVKLRPLINGRLILGKVFSYVDPPVDVVIADSIYMCTWALRMREKGMIRKVVYFCGDWFPWHDKSLSILQRLYRKYFYRPLDIYCTRHSDMVWSVSDRLNAIRTENAPDLLNAAHVLKYPMAFKTPRERGKHDGLRILYIGIPRQDHCLEMLFSAVKKLSSLNETSVGIDIVGHSEYVSRLKECAMKQGLAKTVTFHGMILPGPELDAVVSRCNIGFALYRTVGTENYSYYGFPTKIIQYFSFGLPVIASDITEFAATIRDKKLGHIIPVDEQALTEALKTHLKGTQTDFYSNIARFVRDQNDMAREAYNRRIDMLMGNNHAGT